jgi:hypothetical protein
MTESLRDKDKAVLQAIHNGAETVTEIREATTLSNREINYSLTEYSLEQLDLVEINRSEGREWQKINGQEKNIWKPKKIKLTDQGIQKITELQTESTKYEDMTRRELIQRIHQLEKRQDRLENTFKDFRTKVMKQL